MKANQGKPAHEGANNLVNKAMSDLNAHHHAISNLNAHHHLAKGGVNGQIEQSSGGKNRGK